MRKFYRQFINPGDLCFDIGASVGMFSETFLELRARVVAVEPVEENFQTLVKRLGNYQNLFPVHAAVSDISGTGEIRKGEVLDMSTLEESFALFSEAETKNKITATESVALLTLDELIANRGIPAFCKVDVEGHERQVLQGLTIIIPVISFEYLYAFKENAIACIERIHQLSPNALFNYSLYEFFELENSQWMDKRSFMECLIKFPKDHRTADIFCKLG